MTSLKLFKVTIQSYIKRMKKVIFHGKISFFRHADNYFNSRFHNLRSYCKAILELKPDHQRKGKW